MTSDDIVATTGASGAFVALFAACFDPADNVIVAVPGYPCYERIMKAFSINPERISVDAHTNFQPSVEQVLELVQKKRIRGLIIASPANPTGAVISEEQLEGIASICHQHDIRLIVDEIYHGVCARPPTALLLSQAYPGAGIVVVNSFSKYWCMTGYRIGWLATHDATIIPCLETILQNLSICPPTPSQYTAISALQPVHKSVYERYTESYKRNIDVVCQVLRRAGLQVFSPEGAFYVWANCEGVCNKLQLSGSTELCERLLEECGVACVAGSDFDEVGGEKFVRFSCAGGEDEVREGVHRVEVFVRKM